MLGRMPGSMEMLEKRVVLCIVAIKGVGFGIMSPWFNKAAKYYFSEAHVDANSRSIMMNVATLPWAFRPLLGLTRQRSYLSVLMACATAAFLVLGSLSPSSLSWVGVTALFVCVETALCAHDVVANGMISRSIRQHPQQSHDIASTVWLVKIGFQVLGLGFTGYMLKEHSVLRSFSPCLAGLAILVWFLVTVSSNKAQEEPDDDALGAEQHKKLMLASAFIGTTSATISILPLLGVARPKLLCVVSAVAAVVASSGLDATFGREIALVNGYRMLVNACQPDLRAVTFVFYTDGPEYYPKGPHLDPFFYSAVVGFVARTCALAGIFIYRTFLSDWSFRNVYRLSGILAFLVNVSAMPVYLRWFRTDTRLDLGFILFEEAIRVIVKNIKDIPGTVLSARCCKKGNDATVLALCGAAGHLTEPMQTYVAIILLSTFSVNPSSRADDGEHLKHLWKVKLICGAMVLVPPLFFLNSMIPPGGPSDTAKDDDRYNTPKGQDQTYAAPLLGANPANRGAAGNDLTNRPRPVLPPTAQPAPPTPVGTPQTPQQKPSAPSGAGTGAGASSSSVGGPSVGVV